MNYLENIHNLRREIAAIKGFTPESRRLQRKVDEQIDLARNAFAALNGWKFGGAAFTLGALSRGLMHGGEDDFNIMPGWFDPSAFPNAGYNERDALDHPEFFREPVKPYRAAALIAHSYVPLIRDASAAICEVYGLVQHRPPVPTASWYLPGGTTMIVYTRPDVEVRWFPEQSDSRWVKE